MEFLHGVAPANAHLFGKILRRTDKYRVQGAITKCLTGAGFRDANEPHVQGWLSLERRILDDFRLYRDSRFRRVGVVRSKKVVESTSSTGSASVEAF